MKKVLKVALVYALAAGIGASSHKLYVARHHPLKHTWDCQLIAHDTAHTFWFVRPNRELFEAYFDNPPIFPVYTSFRDIAYTDDNADMRHFVKATLK